MTIRTRLTRLVKAFAGTNGTKAPRRGTARPVVEMLETRLVPASANQVVTVTNAAGCLETFKISSADKQVWHDWQLTAGGSWSGWSSLGSPSGNSLTHLAVSRNADGTLEVFVTDRPLFGADQVYRINQQPAGGGWTSWTSMGGVGDNDIEGLAVGQNVQDGRLEVFVLGANDFHVRHEWQLTPEGPWSGSWADMGDPGAQFGMSVSKIVVAQNAVGDPNNQGLDVFALCNLQSGNYLAESRQTGSNWGPWTALPSGGMTSTNITDFAVGQNQNKRLQVFVATYDSNGGSQVFTDWQQSLGGIWGAWNSEGTPNAGKQLTLQVARNQTSDPGTDGTLEVVASDGTSLYQMAQQGMNNYNSWQNWGGLGTPSIGNTVNSFSIGQNKDGRLEVFVITSDNWVSHDWQVSPAGSWFGWSAMQ